MTTAAAYYFKDKTASGAVIYRLVKDGQVVGTTKSKAEAEKWFKAQESEG